MRANWIWAVEDWVTEEDVKPYELITFEGGLYAAAMSVTETMTLAAGYMRESRNG
jgi:hypothetical protein